MIHLVMPKLGLTMNEGTITRWHVKVGDAIKQGDNIFDVETDKLTHTVTAQEEGVLLQILAEEGQSLAVKEIVGYMGQEGEKAPDREVPAHKRKEPEQASSDLSFDVIVLGGGIGGYSSAIRAAQLGSRVALVEERHLGGTCLNEGCIPTKLLLHSAEAYLDVLHAETLGIKVGDVQLDFAQLQRKKQEKVDQLVRGIGLLLKSNQVEHFAQRGKCLGQHEVALDDGRVLSAEHIVLATGSRPTRLPISGMDLEGVIDSSQALQMEELPASMIIVGGGVIGVEFASFFRDFGVEVTVMEMLPTIGGKVDDLLAMALKDLLEKKGVEVLCEASVKSFEKKDQMVVHFEQHHALQERRAEVILVATGRRPYAESSGAKELGLHMERGAIVVNEYLQTNISNIYAVGDVNGRVLLAHAAEEQGILAAENIHGAKRKLDERFVPACIYTRPEAAWIGLSEQEARDAGKDVQIGFFPLINNSKSLVADQVDNSFVKLVADRKYGEVLGMSMFGPQATELIAVLSLGLKLEITLDELQETIFAHPTVSEALKEVALAAERRAIHQMKEN